MSSRGAPALGQTNIGLLSGVFGSAPLALTFGALVCLGYAASMTIFGRTVRDHKL
jgi:hypothetical protein